ncbi:aspartate/tyrosine/aromatic aminotransferase [Alginatibacterium sediminis]|uniref:Aspartate/tyrosine/aromatic aminotransferase n=1 Tax=Alginatibacterium sediminis TaxID=2164068 RepID=A0A420E5E5_9ALTE|nr:amino acid aminotransferase [Alginatibacterium sediminis]RKF12796.1 aspartate/tyrosine/aromatic aminotransferase [Alginatibacterium sediminis]
MFESLPVAKADPILSLTVAFRQDTRPNKVDLGIGVYRDALGKTPIMKSVSAAQEYLFAQQESKGYVGLAGNESFNIAMQTLLLNNTNAMARAATIQTPGASGGLRLLADLIKQAKPNATVWLSDPSYVNHHPIMEAAGLNVAYYPYFDAQTKQVKEQAMLECLAGLGSDDVVLLHGCCHNPTGADLSKQAWQQIAQLAPKCGFLPFIDIAYQGFGDGLDEDAYGLRLLSEVCDEMLITASCSKNFGLYRERTGMACVISPSIEQAQNAKANLMSLSRKTYTMPPDWGAACVAHILGTERLTANWREELDVMNQRILSLRTTLRDALNQATNSNRFDYIALHKGMFSVTGLTPKQIDCLRDDHAIYMVGDGRMNIAGLLEADVQQVVEAFVAVGA